MRVAINGMGRIGRLLCRRLLQEAEVDVVAVNDIMDIDHLCYLLKYDSLYGSYGMTLYVEKDYIIAGDHRMRVLQQSSPAKLPWQEMQVDVVIECSGRFTSSELAGQHLQAGANVCCCQQQDQQIFHWLFMDSIIIRLPTISPLFLPAVA